MSCVHGDQARHLMLIVRELLELGINPPRVWVDEDGVTETGMTLTDDLSLIAINIDYAAAMSVRLDGDGSNPEEVSQ